MDKKRETANFIAESWRFCNFVETLVFKQSGDEQKRYAAKIEWHRRQLANFVAACGYKIPDFTTADYSPGAAFTPLNADDFAPDDKLTVDYMIEPTILDEGGNIIKFGTAMLRKKEE